MPTSRVYFYLGIAVLVIVAGVGGNLILRGHTGGQAPEQAAEQANAPAAVVHPVGLTPSQSSSDNPAAGIGGPFTLTGEDGKPVSSTDFPGRHLLIFFGYTYCPDVCPTNLTEMSHALDLLGPDAHKVKPIFITIDPGRDTPEQMKMYVAHFHPDLLGLTGTQAQINAVKEEFKVYAAKAQASPDDPEDYLMDHSSMTYLVGPDGKLETFFRAGTDAADMAAKIREFL
jgi:cytochrome oxidase Cu insertion factor (SCO1/SenC/PrrC family)